MKRDSIGLMHSKAHDMQDSATRQRWLRETPLLDLRTPKLYILVKRLTQLHRGDQAIASVIHDHVKSLPFGCIADFQHTSASDVLRIGHGDCHTKGTLFVAMLRAANIPARLRFVTLPTRFLTGLIDTGSATMVHAICEVWLADRWLQTDTYVVDTTFSAAARKLLQTEGKQLGYGVHLLGDTEWDGSDDARAQCTSADPSSLPVVDWGVSDDPAVFYADEDHAALRQSFSVRMKWSLGARMVNRKVGQIRRGL